MNYSVLGLDGNSIKFNKIQNSHAKCSFHGFSRRYWSTMSGVPRMLARAIPTNRARSERDKRKLAPEVSVTSTGSSIMLALSESAIDGAPERFPGVHPLLNWNCWALVVSNERISMHKTHTGRTKRHALGKATEKAIAKNFLTDRAGKLIEASLEQIFSKTTWKRECIRGEKSNWLLVLSRKLPRFYTVCVTVLSLMSTSMQAWRVKKARFLDVRWDLRDQFLRLKNRSSSGNRDDWL